MESIAQGQRVLFVDTDVTARKKWRGALGDGEVFVTGKVNYGFFVGFLRNQDTMQIIVLPHWADSCTLEIIPMLRRNHFGGRIIATVNDPGLVRHLNLDAGDMVNEDKNAALDFVYHTLPPRKTFEPIFPGLVAQRVG